MPHPSKYGPRAGALLLGGLAGLALFARSGEATQAVAPTPAPTPIPAPAPAPYYYGAGPQGFGYYVTPQVQTAAATAPAQVATRRTGSVGPGNRNWATGNRIPLHRPWLNSRR